MAATKDHRIERMQRKSPGGPDGYAMSVQLIRRLATEGVAQAQSYLGHLYFSGRGVPKKHAEAAQWYRKAADQGDATAQSRLSILFLKGLGVPQNNAEAVKWMVEAAYRGSATAQRHLGSLFLVRGRNYVTAHLWFALSAARGDRQAARARDLLAARMTPEQLAEAQQLAREWQPKQA
jgi:TPR repeat protein